MSAPPPPRWVRTYRPQVGCSALLVAVIAWLVLYEGGQAVLSSLIGTDALGGLMIMPATGLVVAVWIWWARAHTYEVPLCPHCGVETDDRFRICRSCGRVKW